MTDNLLTALAAAQAEFPAIPRTKEVLVRTDKGSYKFKYAPLETIFGAVRPVLSKHGLSTFHRIEYVEGKAIIIGVLAHKDGEKIECPFALPLVGKMQEQGSAITYGRRYTIQCLLGIASDDDDDGNAADGNHVEETGKKIARPALTPSPAEKKRNEIEAAFRAAKDAPALSKTAAENKAHIDAMDEAFQDYLRGVYAECSAKFTERKVA